MNRVHEETTKPANMPGASDAVPSQTASNGAVPTKPSRPGLRRPAGDVQPGDQVAGSRQANGRFARGNPGGPGNPFARQTAALRRELLAAVTPQDLCQVVASLIKQAKTGDVAAAKLLLSYAIGTPTPAPDPDTLDQHEWQVLHRQAEPLETRNFMSSVPLETACAVARVAKPVLAEHFLNTIQDSYFGRYWPKRSSISPAPAVAQPAPSAIGASGAADHTPRDRADRRKQLKRKYVLHGGKLCRRDA